MDLAGHDLARRRRAAASAAAQAKCAPRRSSGHVGELAQHQVQVGLVVAVPAGPAGGQDAGHPVQRVDAQPGVVGDRGQPGGRRDRARLEQRVLGEGQPRSRRRPAPRGTPRRPAQLARPARPRRGSGAARRASCALRVARTRTVTAAHFCPAARPAPPAESASAPRSRRRRGRAARRAARGRRASPSAVPCTSTKRPSPVQTTFMSVSAATSSTYSRSSARLPVARSRR